MAPKKAPAKRRNKRKARTDVSSDSSSASSSGDESSLHASSPGPPTNNQADASTEPVTAAEEEIQAPATKRQNTSPEQAFRDFYLRQATKEFANDLDKLRSASDFGAKSVGLLVGALEQGGACFGREERVRVGSGGGK